MICIIRGSINLELLITAKTGTGLNVFGEAVMLERTGTIYPCIDHLYHPNPGTDETGYDEIERPVDWLYRHDISRIKSALTRWVKIRVADMMVDLPDMELADLALEMMYADSYSLSANTIAAIREVYEQFKSDPSLIKEWEGMDEIEVAREIARFINNQFLRVRAGGKLNPEGSDAIYFRISSSGYDWHRVITDFLWDTFGSPDKMPNRIWIGHDAETNPPETTLFDGSASDLFEGYNSKVFAEHKSIRDNIRSSFDPMVQNKDRVNYRIDTSFRKYIRDNNLKRLTFM